MNIRAIILGVLLAPFLSFAWPVTSNSVVVKVGEQTNQRISIPQGESRVFDITYKNGTNNASLSGLTADYLYRPPGSNLWWTIPGTVTAGSGNVRIAWDYTRDPGFYSYEGWVRLSDGGGSPIYRLTLDLSMIRTPGFTVNASGLQLVSAGLSTQDVLNAISSVAPTSRVAYAESAGTAGVATVALSGWPVLSVNGQIGDVTVTAAQVGAVPTNRTLTLNGQTWTLDSNGVFAVTGGGGSGGGISNVTVNGKTGVLTGSGSNILSTVTLVAADVGAVSNTDARYLAALTNPAQFATAEQGATQEAFRVASRVNYSTNSGDAATVNGVTSTQILATASNSFAVASHTNLTLASGAHGGMPTAAQVGAVATNGAASSLVFTNMATTFTNAVQLAQLQPDSFRTWNLWSASNSGFAPNYRLMRTLDYGSTGEGIWTNASITNNQYVGYIDGQFGDGITLYKGGSLFEFTPTLWATLGGSATLSASVEMYLRETNGVERELTPIIGTEAQTITASELKYVYRWSFAADVTKTATESPLIKFKLVKGGSGTVNFYVSTGNLDIPTPSTAYTLQSVFDTHAALSKHATFAVADIAAAGGMTNGQPITAAQLPATVLTNNQTGVTLTLIGGNAVTNGAIPGPGCTDLGTSVNLVLSGATAAYVANPSGVYTVSVSRAVASGYCYSLIVYSTNSYTLASGLVPFGSATIGATNEFGISPMTNNVYYIRQRKVQ